MPGKFTVIATPGADRIAAGEEWLQTNTLDGQKGHDSFIRIGRARLFPGVRAGRLPRVDRLCQPGDHQCPLAVSVRRRRHRHPRPCTSSVTGKVTGVRLSRTPDERLYSSGSRDTYYWTQCYVSFGDPDGEDFAFTKCAPMDLHPQRSSSGGWRITIFDQWNDQIVDGLATPANLVVRDNHSIWETFRFSSGRRTSIPARSSTTPRLASRRWAVREFL